MPPEPTSTLSLLSDSLLLQRIKKKSRYGIVSIDPASSIRTSIADPVFADPVSESPNLRAIFPAALAWKLFFKVVFWVFPIWALCCHMWSLHELHSIPNFTKIISQMIWKIISRVIWHFRRNISPSHTKTLWEKEWSGIFESRLPSSQKQWQAKIDKNPRIWDFPSVELRKQKRKKICGFLFLFVSVGVLLWLVRAQHDHYESKYKRKARGIYLPFHYESESETTSPDFHL